MWAFQKQITRITKVAFVVVMYDSVMIPGDIRGIIWIGKIGDVVYGLYAKWSAVKELM